MQKAGADQTVGLAQGLAADLEVVLRECAKGNAALREGHKGDCIGTKQKAGHWQIVLALPSIIVWCEGSREAGPPTSTRVAARADPAGWSWLRRG